jgi:hypothetical protein
MGTLVRRDRQFIYSDTCFVKACYSRSPSALAPEGTKRPCQNKIPSSRYFQQKNLELREPRIAPIATCAATIVAGVSSISFQARCGDCDRPAGQADPLASCFRGRLSRRSQDQSGG